MLVIPCPGKGPRGALCAGPQLGILRPFGGLLLDPPVLCRLQEGTLWGLLSLRLSRTWGCTCSHGAGGIAILCSGDSYLNRLGRTSVITDCPCGPGLMGWGDQDRAGPCRHRARHSPLVPGLLLQREEVGPERALSSVVAFRCPRPTSGRDHCRWEPGRRPCLSPAS